MTREDIRKTVAGANDEINQHLRSRDAFVRLSSYLDEDELSLLSSIQLYSFSIDLFFTNGADRDSCQRLAAKLTRLLGRGVKTANGASLYVHWSSANPDNPLGVAIYLHNYVPPKCHVVKQTRTIPAQPERVEEYESIVCEQEEESL